ncbi:MAG: thiamine biosynthesis protein ThiF [Rhodobacteraceae bacterium]|nr:thiamine biosynthesis protein ThiF [Paracoccaceae bacterium]
MNADSFHRLAKVLADSGEAETIEAAQAALAAYGVRIVLDKSVEEDISAQVIALTAINCASRCFMGNLQIDAPRDTVLKTPGFIGSSLSDFAAWAGVRPALGEQAQGWPIIEIGVLSEPRGTGAIRPWANAWSFGINGEARLQGAFVAPACVAAGGLAVSEAFSMLRRDNPYAGRRALALSLWDPRGVHGAIEEGPIAGLEVPSAWLVGLGHLGQAYAWTLGFMRPASGGTLFLQDVDAVTSSTPSTSVLSTPIVINQRKTRVVAAWLEARGYQTAVVERCFDEFQRVAATEPRVALFGVDNAAARRVLEGAGFSHVIDAGLGSGFRDFKAIRVRTFPGPSNAADLWAAIAEVPKVEKAPAYQALLASGVDPCGVTMLATRSVGAPFVGCVAAGYVIAALMRCQLGLDPFAVIDLNLRNPTACDALVS